MKRFLIFWVTGYAAMGLFLPLNGSAQTCAIYTVNALANCVGSANPSTDSLGGVSIPVVPGQSYTLSIITSNPSRLLDFGTTFDSSGKFLTLYGTRLRVYQYSAPNASDAVYIGLLGQGSAQEVIALDPYPWGNLPVSMIGTDIFSSGAAAMNYLIANPSYDTYAFTASTNFIALTVDDLLTPGYCGDNSGFEDLQLCTISSPVSLSPTPTPTPSWTSTFTPTPTPTDSSTFTPTPTITLTPTPTITPIPTSTVTVTPTFTPICQLHVWPNPFNPSFAFNGVLNIDCLQPQSTVSFYTISGETVMKVPEAGGIAQWNGKNKSGVPIAPGIYFYIIEEGEKVYGRGKILVTR